MTTRLGLASMLLLSLGTAALAVAMQRRDELLARLAHEGEPVPKRPSRTPVDPVHGFVSGGRSVSLAT